MDIVLENKNSLVNEIITTIFSYFNNKKKNSQYIEIIKKIENDKKSFENDLLLFVESKISNSNFIYDEILSKYNLDLLITTSKLIFQKLNIQSEIKTKIEETIKNYKFLEKLNHFNILILGRSGIGKSTLVNSILELEGTPEAAPTGRGRAVTEGEPKGYISNTKKGLRLWDSQGIDKEKYHISKAVESVKNLINIASINNDPDKFIHCIWYCVSGQRFEESERESLIELMKIYDDDTLPIIIVYTEAYNEEDADSVCEEIRNVLKEKINKNKEINICQVVAKNKEIKMCGNNFVIEKQGIKKLMDISLEKIILAVNSACFFSFKNKLKKDNENEISNNQLDLKKIVEERANGFQSRNSISNIGQLNKQIINKIINILLNPKEITKEIKGLISSLFKNYQEFILNECNNHFPQFLGNCSSELFINYKIENRNQDNNEDNEDKLNIQKQINLNMNLLLNNQNKKNNNKKNRNGVEDELFNKVKILYKDFVIKKSSIYIDNKINEELSKLIIESFNNQINNYNEIIEKIVKESMNQQSLNIINNFKFE